LEQLEAEFARALKENAEYLRARMVEAEIIKRKFKLPEFQAQMEAELEQVKEQLRQEKKKRGYVGFPAFRTFCLLMEIGKRDPQFISETLDDEDAAAILGTDDHENL
jgi:hypothetical protein